MRRLPTLVLGLSCVGLLAGCRKAPPPPARTDAGVEASAARGPYTLAIAARFAGIWNRPIDYDDLLLVSGDFFVYAVPSDGILRRLGNAADYTPLFGDLSDEMFGREAVRRLRAWDSRRIDGKVVLIEVSAEYGKQPTSFQWDGRAWKSMSQPDREVHPSRSPTPVPADAGITEPEGDWGEAYRVRDGRYAWSRSTEDGVEIYVARPHGGPGRVSNPVKRHPKTGGPVMHGRCSFPRSMDTRLHVMCSVTASDGGWSSDVYRLDGDDTWVRLDIPERDSGEVAVDADGALWFPIYEEHAIGRRTTDGTTTKFEIPTPDPATTRPSFMPGPEDPRSTRAQAEGPAATERNPLELAAEIRLSVDPDRRWKWGSIMVPECRPSSVRWVTWFVPQPSGDVWIGIHCWGNANVQMILRASRSEYTGTPIVNGTIDDELNEIRNAKPPRPWVTPCNQLFVMLATASGEAGALNVDRILAERAAIDDLTKAFRTSGKFISTVRIVSGRLHDRKVAGVLLARTHPGANQAAMDKAARDLVKRFTTNPASPPEVFCTLPVLEKTL